MRVRHGIGIGQGFEVIEARAEAHRAHAHATTPGYVGAAKVAHVHAALGRDAQRL